MGAVQRPAWCAKKFMGLSVVLRKLPADGAEDVFDGSGGCDVYCGSGLGGFEDLEGLVSGWGCAACENGAHRDCATIPISGSCCCFGTHECRYCAGGEHNLCTVVPGPDGCCCGTAANMASARTDPIGFVTQVGKPEKVLEGEEGPPNRRRLIQVRPATRKLERGFRRLGVKIFRVTCNGCRKPALVAKSTMAILASAKDSGEEIDVICDRCIENYPGRSEEPYSEEQKAEGVHVARVLDVNQRRN